MCGIRPGVGSGPVRSRSQRQRQARHLGGDLRRTGDTVCNSLRQPGRQQPITLAQVAPLAGRDEVVFALSAALAQRADVIDVCSGAAAVHAGARLPDRSIDSERERPGDLSVGLSCSARIPLCGPVRGAILGAERRLIAPVASPFGGPESDTALANPLGTPAGSAQPVGAAERTAAGAFPLGELAGRAGGLDAGEPGTARNAGPAPGPALLTAARVRLECPAAINTRADRRRARSTAGSIPAETPAAVRAGLFAEIRAIRTSHGAHGSAARRHTRATAQGRGGQGPAGPASGRAQSGNRLLTALPLSVKGASHLLTQTAPAGCP